MNMPEHLEGCRFYTAGNTWICRPTPRASIGVKGAWEQLTEREQRTFAALSIVELPPSGDCLALKLHGISCELYWGGTMVISRDKE